MAALAKTGMIELRPHHWTAAGAVALGLHALVFLAVFAGDNDGAKAPGLGGISVAMTMTATRAGSDSDAAERQALEQTQAPPPAEAAPVPPDAVEAPADVVPETVEAFEPLPAVTPTVPVEAAIAVAPPPKPVKAKPVQAKPKPTPAPKPATKAAPAATAKPAAKAETAQRASQAAAATQGKLADGRKGQSADERNALGGGPVGTPAPNYVNQLRYWLERNKTYPKEARRMRQQGVVNLYFRVTRDGRVLAHDIRKSSGHKLLDGEAEAMLKRAQPLPKFPDGMKGGYLDVVVPVLFSLRGNS